VNILIVFLLSGDLKTLYDAEGKYDHVEVGAFVLDSNGVSGWVVSLPGSVQEGNHVLQSERPWLLEQGKHYAQSQVTGTAILVYYPQTESLATVFDCKQQYREKLGVAVDGTYAVCLWHDCTADTIPVFMQAALLEPAYREFFLAQGREYQAQAATATNPQ